MQVRNDHGGRSTPEQHTFPLKLDRSVDGGTAHGAAGSTRHGCSCLLNSMLRIEEEVESKACGEDPARPLLNLPQIPKLWEKGDSQMICFADYAEDVVTIVLRISTSPLHTTTTAQPSLCLLVSSCALL